MLCLIEIHTDTLIAQTKTKPEETLETKLKKQMEVFSFSPLINLFERGKWLLAVTSFQTTNSVFNVTRKNNSFSFATPRYWTPKCNGETNKKLNELLELRSQNDVQLHVKEVVKRGARKNGKSRV